MTSPAHTRYFNGKSSDFDEIWYTTADLELDDSHVTKYEIFFYKFSMVRGLEVGGKYYNAVNLTSVERRTAPTVDTRCGHSVTPIRPSVGISSY